MTVGLLSQDSLAEALGAGVEDVVALAGVRTDPAHLDFLGLMQARGQNHLVPDAVVLHQGQPLLYVWDGQTKPMVDEAELRRSMRRLALRSDAPYVAILRPGSVQVFALADVRDQGAPLIELAELAPGLIARLAVGDVPARADGYSTHQLMLELLNAVTEELIHGRGVAASDALALVGRALFLRFLADRGLIPMNQPFPDVAHVTECFATPQNAAASCRWLDETFNGDLLELPGHGSETYFTALHLSATGSALHDLTAIVRGDKPLGGGAYQTQFSWADLHFSYIPVGLLSQVYEEYSHRFETTAARELSVYYTPRHLAEYMVDHAMGMLGPDAHNARVLDPASGGGVFLLAAFRRLVQSRWRATGEQPRTAVIRDILNTQLVGMDINPAARQLNALALYLTALELDPDVGQLQNLKFKALHGRVLIDAAPWRDHGSGLALGSLTLPVPASLAGQFDLVIGNPPWTAVKGQDMQRAIDRVSQSAMTERGIDAVPNPDGVPDLPFVWQATRWAKPDGILAFALHGRLLTKTGEQGVLARRTIFEGLTVTYVLNGMELRNTKVWPGMTANFCLLFAVNRVSDPESAFYAVTPLEDACLNREGRVRIDSKDAWASDPAMVAQIPHLFKTLAKGNALDVEVLARIGQHPPDRRTDRSTNETEVPAANAPRPTLLEYFTQLGLAHGHGYQTSSQKEDAGFLFGTPDMPDPRDARWPVVPTHELSKFALPRLHRVRAPAIYRAPLVLLRESPSSRSEHPLAMLAFEDVAFRRSYIGFSCVGAPQPELLATYLWAIFNSSLFLYYILMTSSRLGCERSTLLKDEAERLPIVALEELPATKIALLQEWLRHLKQPAPPRMDIDAFVYDVYGLRSADRQLIQDRLAIAMPFASTRKAATRAPTQSEVNAFCQTLRGILNPFDMSAEPLVVTDYAQSDLAPWRFVRLGGSEHASPSMQQLLIGVNVANHTNASLVECVAGDAMFVGVLNQRRYWTRTAARTLALDIIKRGHAILARSGPTVSRTVTAQLPRGEGRA